MAKNRAIMAAVLGVVLSAEAAAPPAPRFVVVAAGKEFRCDTGAVTGTLRRGGKSFGLVPLVDKTTGKPIARGTGMFSLYRLLSADSRYGPAAWDWPSKARLLDDGAVEARWTADAKHPFDMKAVYRWRRANTLDLTVTVTASKALPKFEVFLATYLDGFAESLVYARDGKAGFVEAKQSDGHWQMFPRDDDAVRLIKDGRWKRPPHPVDWKIRPRLAAPLAMRRDAKSGLAAVVMAPADDCFAVATPYGKEGHRSLYLSLLGRDLKPRESATVRARLVIARGVTDPKAVALYETYLKELAAGTKTPKGTVRH